MFEFLEEKMSTIADALKKATKEKKKNGNGSSLPDLTQIQIEGLKPEEIAEKEKEAQERRQWAENAAQKLIEIREKIRQLKKLAVHGVIKEEDKKEISQLQQLENRILSAGDKELQKHIIFAEFLCEIREAGPNVETAKSFVERVVTEGRYRITNQEEVKQMRQEKKAPSGAIFFLGNVYLPVFADEEKSPGQKALESELVRYVREVNAVLARERKSRINEIKNIPAKELVLFKQGEPGFYRLVFQEREDESGKRWKAGIGLIELQDLGNDDKPFLVIMVKKGIGSLEWFNRYIGKWIPYFWYKKREVPETAPDPEFAEKIIKTIRAAFAAHYSFQK